MNIQEIENLITEVTESGVGEVKIITKKVQITVKTVKSIPNVASYIYQPNLASSPVNQVADVELSKNEKQETDNYVIVESPYIGTFHLESHPNKSNFVELEQDVSKGALLCVVESMKIFNEVKSELSGTIVDILVDNYSPVEYAQPLFLINPKS